MSNNKIGFYNLIETADKDSYVGSLLVTTEKGIPIEYKCTHAVKPTSMQKSLYGTQLKPYIAINLCGVPLLNSIATKPDLLFIVLPEIIAIKEEIEIPTFFIHRASEPIDLKVKNHFSKFVKIDNETNQYNSIDVCSYAKISTELTSNIHLIKELYNTFDLLEPFERMRTSVEILGKTDEKFK